MVYKSTRADTFPVSAALTSSRPHSHYIFLSCASEPQPGLHYAIVRFNSDCCVSTTSFMLTTLIIDSCETASREARMRLNKKTPLTTRTQQCLHHVFKPAYGCCGFLNMLSVRENVKGIVETRHIV